MFRPELNPALPNPDEPEFESRLVLRLNDILQRNAKAMRQMQAPVFARVSKNGFNQSIAAGVETKVVMASSGNNYVFDTHGFWDSTNNRFLPRETGYYRYSAQARFTTFSVVPTTCKLTVMLSNVPYSRGEVNVTATTQSPVVQTSGVVWIEGKQDGSSLFWLEVLAESTLADAVIDGSWVYTSLSVDYVGADQIR